ncbi:MAG: pentapeptide repeat-containing protein [Merismopedia sp. SIO2A8]|nr:pentapeptide repeat-containing protein [Merismopedia sp. SIO2A8]
MSGTVLRGISLCGATLEQTSFRDSDLSGFWDKPNPVVKSDFREANCCGADFSGATLEVIDFSGAFLSKANFSNAVLDKVWFIDADLEGVIWLECRIWRSSVEGAKLGRGMEGVIWTDWRK